jgi:acetyl esterase/lipase
MKSYFNGIAIHFLKIKMKKNKKILVCLMMMFLIVFVAHGQETINIWKNVNKVKKQVVLEQYLPKQDNNKHIAVIVCPGGSYCWLSNKTEGVEVAKWLNENGITAFVLNYRHAGFMAFFSHYRLLFRGNQYPDMLEDVQRSITLIRENADRYNIDKNKVGVMGFSAGGHLAMMSGEFFDTDFLLPLEIKTKESLRPDFLVPIYPVVTLDDKQNVHKRSRRGLLGETRKYSKVMRDSLSVEKHIKTNTPPVFLMNCVDDKVVKYQNSLLLDSALTANNIKHKYVQYKTGGHGFGADNNKASKESIQWKKEFIDWLKTIM